MYAPPRPNTQNEPARPARSRTHKEGQFCNGPCALCDEQMARRSARYARQHTQDLGRIMRQAPTTR